ncbi:MULTISPECIES: RDD family protein [Thiomicrorhabdus]|uniref:RDD family protein n=1 Tax=Thiomicrorhabdus heinhorstiae TaxID=2748010 RepID=A0ABS0BVN9_9GAMM|nr:MULTISPECIES: RDD family protein [Thiomicrorhabdus]MBF6057140.1 RDD family protein [Thiomicrorhabdus heinhorstiae]
MNGLKILFAQIYDFILLCAIWFGAAIPFVLWQGGGEFEKNPILLLGFQLYLLAITYLYLTYFWTQSGQTPGLRTWKLQLRRQDDFLMTRHNANLRFLLSVLLFPIGWVGLFLPGQQLLQDRLAKTKIVAVQPEGSL